MHRPLPDEIYGDIVAYNGCEGLCNVETPPPPTANFLLGNIAIKHCRFKKSSERRYITSCAVGNFCNCAKEKKKKKD